MVFSQAPSCHCLPPVASTLSALGRIRKPKELDPIGVQNKLKLEPSSSSRYPIHASITHIIIVVSLLLRTGGREDTADLRVVDCPNLGISWSRSWLAVSYWSLDAVINSRLYAHCAQLVWYVLLYYHSVYYLPLCLVSNNAPATRRVVKPLRPAKRCQVSHSMRS